MARRWRLPALLLAGAAGLASCSTLNYYAHLGRGQWQVLNAREPIDRILADPQRDPELRRRLGLAMAARDYASQRLALPANGSYRRYADLGRPYVVWNVFAAPELSLQALEHCFPIAGCVAYRGYYSEAEARAEALRLQAQGYETHIGGVPAYSTLGWFDDPLLNTMLRWDDDRLLETLFHELAHQKVYLPGDTAFNESYASFVGEQGLREWRAARGQVAEGSLALQREAGFVALLSATRERLEAAYASAGDDAARRAAKSAAFAQLAQDYAALKASWNGWGGYDRFFATPMNNAKLLPFALYNQHLAAFAALFAREGGDWPRFHAAVAALADEPAEARGRALAALTADPVLAHAR